MTLFHKKGALIQGILQAENLQGSWYGFRRNHSFRDKQLQSPFDDFGNCVTGYTAAVCDVPFTEF